MHGCLAETVRRVQEVVEAPASAGPWCAARCEVVTFRAAATQRATARRDGYALRRASAVLCAALSAAGLSCADAEQRQLEHGIRPSYDEKTGRLVQLDYDSNKNGRTDTWTVMNGAKPIESRIDRNEDGKVERWEFYGDRGELTKVGFSRNGDGQPDAWAFPGPDQTVQKIEISSTRDEHRIDRWEYYDAAQSGPEGQGALVRAEQDTDADGKPDMWETYDAGALETVAFDENRDGIADRRLTYEGATLVLIESQPDASGRFVTRTPVK
jgi:hypothetical protein